MVVQPPSVRTSKPNYFDSASNVAQRQFTWTINGLTGKWPNYPYLSCTTINNLIYYLCEVVRFPVAKPRLQPKSIFSVHSARARAKPGLFPHLLPLPDAGGFVEDAVARLVRQHQNLAAMVGLVREHISEHGPSAAPPGHPTAP